MAFVVAIVILLIPITNPVMIVLATTMVAVPAPAKAVAPKSQRDRKDAICALLVQNFYFSNSLESIASKVNRVTVDLSAYPDLVVIYLGMRVNRLRGLKTLLSFGPKIAKSVEAKPDGLLLHENLIFSLFPPHAGVRQYWRDFESLEAWARSMPHQKWWTDFVRDSGGTGFWHETYFARGGIEAIYESSGGAPSLGLPRSWSAGRPEDGFRCVGCR